MQQQRQHEDPGLLQMKELMKNNNIFEHTEPW